MVQRVFETLLKFPDGLPIKDLVGQIDERGSTMGTDPLTVGMAFTRPL